MPTVTPLLDKRYTSKDNTFPIVVRVIHAGQRRNIATGFKVTDAHFKNGKAVKVGDAAIINSKITSLVADAQRYLADCSLNSRKVHLNLIGTGRASNSFTEYLSKRAEQYQAKSQLIMAAKVKRFVVELTECFASNVFFDDVTPSNLRDYEAYLIKNGNGDNTRHKKFKMLSEFYAAAINEGVAEGRNPFKGHKIAAKPVNKDKLTVEQIHAIEGLKLNGDLNDYRNLFLFSYYVKGSRFATCVTLSRKQIRDGRVHIKMDKGEKYISVQIHSRLRRILDQYKGKDLVFPFLKTIPTNPREYLSVIGSQNTLANKALKAIAKLAGINQRVTFHQARHTFAHHLKQVTDNINIIQESLGHSDQRTTQIYLKSLGDEVLDKEMKKLYGK
jgi:integrase/recombinase XerD